MRGVTDGDITRYRGIPYAASPTGERRWQAPQAPARWDGVREASRSGPACAQGPARPNTSEDCLYLDVTAPAGAEGKPVMVWLHGGGLSEGAGVDYDPRRMVEQGDVVVVTVDFRLGIFGLFGRPGLPGSGTFTLQDQQAALRWVRDTIAGFGGDPGNVTLFGESGGAVGACAQLTSPQAAGLFHRVILQSSTCGIDAPPNAAAPGSPPFRFFQPLAQIEATGADTAKVLHCDSVACLRKLPTSAFDKEYPRYGFAATGTPTLPVDPEQALRTGPVHPVPVLTGYNRDEHRFTAGLLALAGYPIDYPKLIREAFGNRAAAILKHYPIEEYDGNGALAWAAVYTDRMWACRINADRMALATRMPTWEYEFADRRAQPFVDLPRDFPAGASHASELPNLFDVAGRQPITSQRYDDTQRSLAKRMIGAWTTFARTGDPGWARGTTQRLAPEGDVPIDGAAEHNCTFWRR